MLYVFWDSRGGVEIFWIVTPCSVVAGYKRWQPTTRLRGLKTQKTSTSNMCNVSHHYHQSKVSETEWVQIRESTYCSYLPSFSVLPA